VVTGLLPEHGHKQENLKLFSLGWFPSDKRSRKKW
jgi:hypothetical protein